MRAYLKEVLAGLALGVLAFSIWAGHNVWPFMLLGGLVFLLFQSAGLRGGFQRKYVNIVGNTVSHVEFADIGGQDTAKKELCEALDFLRNYEASQKLGIRPLKGILLTGPPGTGKTMLAKAAATYTDSIFMSTSGSEFIEVYAGVGAQRVRDLFRKARESARHHQKKSAIIFVDEIEVLGGKRGQHTSHLEYDQTLNQLLVEMDGLSVEDDVRILLIGASNRADLLDSALLRPGRFDRIVRVGLPDREGRKHILSLHTRNKPLDPAVDLDRVARETFGFSGAHLEGVTNEAAILALRQELDTIHQHHFEEAIDKVILGERLERRPKAAEMERIAIHEAGHAVMAEILRPHSVAVVQVSPRGGTLGHVRHSPADDQYMYSRPWLEDDIAILLSGAIAEERSTGCRSSGSANDFETAVDIARRIVFLGLSSAGIVDRQSASPDTVNRAVNDILTRQEQRVRRSLRRYGAAVDEVARVLVQEERATGQVVRRILEGSGFLAPDPARPSSQPLPRRREHRVRVRPKGRRSA
ncbi:MAG: AAA family ATPase [Bacillota bacterium]